jgi:hypothetical protein
VLPFSAEQFFAVFARYNEAIWPAQIVAYAAGAGVVVLTMVRRRWSGTAVAIVLAALWLWTGVAYHALHFAPINRLAYVFAGLYALQAALWVWQGRRLRFSGASAAATGLAVALIAYAAIVYPAVGWAAGHAYPAAPTFGVTPCPLTLFSLGVLLLAPSAPRLLYVVPLLWSLIGGSAALLLDVPQDWALLVGGPLAVGVLLFGRGAISRA